MSALAIIIPLLVLAFLVVVLLRRLKPGSSYGSAGFGNWPGPTAKTLAQLPNGMLFGRDHQGHLAGWSSEGHWLVVAPTGAGKSTGVLAPTIANWGGPLLAVDIKGELARTCAPALSRAGVECLRIAPL